MHYPIGLAGQSWGESERAEWRAQQTRRRSYEQDVLSRIDALGDRFDTIDYGTLACDGDHYPLRAVRTRGSGPRPAALITGGVHGYETSGVVGALEFLDRYAAEYADRVDLIVVPCVSPWAYERISRWNRDAADPNRNFRIDGPSHEATALIDLTRAASDRYLLHLDLHETTDSDEAEFRPALSARDGTVFEPGQVPEGFYLVADAADPRLAFQAAIIDAVRQVTRIAPPDAQGEIIGSRVIANGVIAYPLVDLGLCTSITGARFTSVTEVYPDAPDITARVCVEAQVTAIRAALDHALAQASDAS